jgi:pimeloyl-ACP methyl ester carboxylesterase
MGHLAGKKSRKAIPKKRDKVAENHPHRKRLGGFGNRQSRERANRQGGKGSKAEEPERFGEPRLCMRKLAYRDCSSFATSYSFKMPLEEKRDMTQLNKRKGQENSSRTREPKHGKVEGLAPPVGRLYTVERRHLALHRSGSGEPAVVFLPGAGMVGLDFLNIHEQVSQFTTSVLYDRAGTGWSEACALPRTATEVTDELHSLLREAGVQAPYLLVGHSLGGAYARRYAQRWPSEVAGLLLLEPTHEDFEAYLPKQTALDQLRGVLATLRLLLHYKTFYRGVFSRMFASWPDEVREPLINWHLRSLRKTFQEWPPSDRTGKGSLSTELRTGGNTPDVPLIVLCATGIDPFYAAIMPESYLRKMNDGHRVLYRALAASVPRGEYREVENAGHDTIHTERPDAVLRAIRDLIDPIRDGATTPQE